MFQNVLSNLLKASLKIVFFKLKLTKNLVLDTESNTPSSKKYCIPCIHYVSELSCMELGTERYQNQKKTRIGQKWDLTQDIELIELDKKFINKLIFEIEKDQNLIKYILEFKFVLQTYCKYVSFIYFLNAPIIIITH